LRIFKGQCRKSIGVDVDPRAATNPFLDEFRLIENNRWPVADESIDVSICNSVLDHVDDPDGFFREGRRVTRPGGFACIRTSNVLSYFGLASILVPDRLHLKARAVVQSSSPEEEDVFPTVYLLQHPAQTQEDAVQVRFRALRLRLRGGAVISILLPHSLYAGTFASKTGPECI